MRRGLIYADALQELGDPRGDLIALQCAPALDRAQKARVTALLDTHGHAWLGELAPVVHSDYVFEGAASSRAARWTSSASIASRA